MLVGPLVVTFLLSFRPSVLPSVQAFLWIVSLTFSKFWHDARNPYEVARDKARFFRKCFCLPQKLGKWTQNGSKTDLFKLLKNLFIDFYLILSIMKIYIIFFVAAQIPFLGKFLLLRYGLKYSLPFRMQEFLINHISRWNKWNNLIFSCWHKFT